MTAILLGKNMKKLINISKKYNLGLDLQEFDYRELIYGLVKFTITNNPISIISQEDEWPGFMGCLTIVTMGFVMAALNLWNKYSKSFGNLVIASETLFDGMLGNLIHF